MSALTVRVIADLSSDTPERHTFPIADAELTPKLIEECGLEEGLIKFGRMLACQYKDVSAVEIHSIGVTFRRMG